MARRERSDLSDDSIRALGGAVGLWLDKADLKRLTPEVNNVFAFLQELWEEDLGETEPAVRFVPEEE